MVNAGTLDEALNANELVRFFFLVDSINPTDFLANYVDVSGSVQVKAPVEPGKPTRSTATFRQGENAPAGYPRWFLAAYPDVVVWLAAKDQDSMLRISAEAMYGPEGAKELIRIHGLKRISELMDEKFEGFDMGQLRRLIAGFRRDTRKRLECTIVVKERLRAGDCSNEHPSRVAHSPNASSATLPITDTIPLTRDCRAASLAAMRPARS